MLTKRTLKLTINYINIDKGGIWQEFAIVEKRLENLF